MLNFRRATVSDFDKIRDIISEFDEFSCELTEINLLLWQDIYDFKFCILNDMLFTKNCVNGVTTFGIPFSKNMNKGLAILKEYCEEAGLKLKFFAVQGERLELFKQNVDEEFIYEPVRDSFEYIYDRETLTNLSGKKYHSKRNHISGFMRKYRWSFERLSNENFLEVKNMLAKWYEENRDKKNDNMAAEQNGLYKILDEGLFNKFLGGVLRVDEQVIAFTLGCKISNEIFDVNIEKALSSFDGAYAMINNLFVKSELSEFKYVNREEDMGIEGLRRAKLSYRPAILLEKFLITKEE